MITERQRTILNYLIKEYIDSAEPISSSLLKEKYCLDISPATIRNELQNLTENGYITQPHTSAGRIPTNKGYRYFVQIVISSKGPLPGFVKKEIEEARQKIDKELELVQELMNYLSEISSVLDFDKEEGKDLFDVLKIIGQSRTTYNKNVDLMKGLLKELKKF